MHSATYSASAAFVPTLYALASAPAAEMAPSSYAPRPSAPSPSAPTAASGAPTKLKPGTSTPDSSRNPIVEPHR